MKRNFIITTLLMFAVTFYMQACSSGDGEEQTASQAQSQVEKTEKSGQATQQAATQKPATSQQNNNYPMAPNFALEDANGTTIRLSDFKGKVVILDFWATWCAPCRMEIPGYVELYDKYKSQGLEIIGVSLDRDGWKPVRPFMDQYNVNYPIVLGDMNIVQAYGGIQSIPTTFIINRNGEVVERKIGARPVEYFENIISQLL